MEFTVAVTARAFERYGEAEYRRLTAAGITIGRFAEGPVTEPVLLGVLEGADAVICSVDPPYRGKDQEHVGRFP